MGRNNTKEKILNSAIDLFYEVGFVKASIRDLVEGIGISKAAVYFHFKNKDEILYQIILDLNVFVMGELNAVIEQYDDPVECLKKMIFRQIHLTTEKRKEIKIYMEEQYQLPPTLRKQALQRHRQVYDLYYNKICEINKRLSLNMNRVTTTFSVFGMINWVYRWVKDDGDVFIEEVAEDIVGMLFEGIVREKCYLTGS